MKTIGDLLIRKNENTILDAKSTCQYNQQRTLQKGSSMEEVNVGVQGKMKTTGDLPIGKNENNGRFPDRKN